MNGPVERDPEDRLSLQGPKPLRDMATEAQKAVSEELLAAWQLQVTRVEQQLHSGWEEHIRSIVADKFSALTARLQQAGEEAGKQAGVKAPACRPNGHSEDVELADHRATGILNTGVKRIQAASTRTQWTSAVVDSALSFAQRATLLSLRDAEGPLAAGVLDLEFDSGKALPSEPVPLRMAPAFLSAMQSGQPVFAVRAGTEISVALENMLGPGGSRAQLFPILAQDKAFAVLYAEGTTDSSAMELLTAAAGMSAMVNRDILQRAFVERVSSPKASPRPSGWNQLPVEDQERHLRAQRFARTQAAQLRLYKPEEVREGRATSDLYGMLREHIDQARQTYHDQFVVGCESMVDYLHVELVKTLANNDESLLGGAYPGPLD